MSGEDSPTAEDTKDHESIEIAFTKALCAFFPKIKAVNATAEFFATYRKEAEAYDRDFAKKHDEDLNTTLIFAGLFSAVTSAFIIDVQTNLQPDYAQETVALLRILIQTGNNSTSPPLPTEWVADPAVVMVQAVLYASLAASLLAAFLAMLGKQWLNRYLRGRGGSAIEKGRDRQIKASGMESWKFPIVMEALPLMLQAALLLFGCALSRYLWTINAVVAVVNIFFTAAGVIIYMLIVFLATLSYACPYQTPLSFALRYLAELDAQHTHYILSLSSAMQPLRLQVLTTWNWVSSSVVRFVGWLRTLFTPSRRGDDTEAEFENTSSLRNPSENTECLGTIGVSGEPAFNHRDQELYEHASDAQCISWILETSTDPDVIYSAIRLIPKINWINSENIPQLDQLADLVNSCCTNSSGELGIYPGMETTALMALKALLHAFTYQTLRGNHTPFPTTIVTEFWYPVTDLNAEFRSTAEVLRYYSFANSHSTLPIWPSGTSRSPSTSISHQAWLCQILLYQTWLRQKTGGSIPEDLFNFLESCCAKRPKLPTSIINDCLVIAGLCFSVPFNLQDLSAPDKSNQIERVVLGICSQIQRVFHHPRYHTLAGPATSALKVFLRAEVNFTSWSFRDLLRATLQSSSLEKWTAAQAVLELEAGRSASADFSTLGFLDLHVDDIITVLDHLFDLTRYDLQPEKFDETTINSVRLLSHLCVEIGVCMWKDNIVSFLCKALKPGTCNPDAQHGILYIIGNTRGSDAQDVPEALVLQISSAVRNFWDSIPQDSHRDHLPVFIALLEKFHSQESWHHILIRDFCRPLNRLQDLLPNSYERFLFTALVEDLGPKLFTLLEEANDPHISKAWLRLAWRYHKELLPNALPRLLHATADLFHDGDESIIREFHYIPRAWIQIHSKRDRAVTEVAQLTAVLVDTYLVASWKAFPDEGSERISMLLRATSGVYAIKGYDLMDKSVVDAWLETAWTKLGYRLEREVEDATLEAMRRGGVAVVKGYRNALSSPLRHLETTFAFMEVAEDRGDFDGDKHRHLRKLINATKKRLGILEEIWLKCSTEGTVTS